LDHCLVLGIDRRQGLVEDQDRCVAQQRARNREPLPLPARQIDAALADDGLIPVRQMPDEFMRVGVARRLFQLGRGRIRLAEPQILLDRAMEQVGVLVHDGDQAAQRLGIECADVLPAHPHRPGLRIEQAQQQARDRGFPGAARADDADLLAGRDGEGEPVMRCLPPPGIGEMHVFESDRRHSDNSLYRIGGADWGEGASKRRWLHERLGGEQRVNPSRGRLSDHALMQHAAEIAQRTEHFGAGHQHDQQGLDRHQPV